MHITATERPDTTTLPSTTESTATSTQTTTTPEMTAAPSTYEWIIPDREEPDESKVLTFHV